MSNEKIKVAFIGLGNRGFAHAYSCSLLKDKIEIVACADIIPDKVERFAKEYGVPAEMCFESAEQLLERERLADILFVCTMDQQHYGHSIPALRKGYHLMLEKPISNDPLESMEIARVANECQRHVVVCHSLRYVPHYRKIKEIMDSGELGEIMCIQANEEVCYWHQAHSFVRGNWRNSKLSSPMILQKCCHDMDMILWLTGKHCVRLSSFGSLSHLKSDKAPEGAHDMCSEACPAYKDCPYSIKYYLDHIERGTYGWPMDVVEPEMDKFKETIKTSPYGRCAYKCDNDVVDHQVVNLLLEDDLTVTFNMCAFTSGMGGGRGIHVMGTKGDLRGSMGDPIIRVNIFGKGEYQIDRSSSETDDLSHGGGDLFVVKDFVDLLEGKLNSSVSSVDKSVESHVVCMAAEKSRLEGGQVVVIDEYMKSLREGK